MGYIFIAGANLLNFAYVVINNVYYVITRNMMFNTNEFTSHCCSLYLLLYFHLAKLDIKGNNILIESVCQS